MAQQDAVTLLDDDHRKVELLFARYKSTGDMALKQQLAHQICQELTVHAQIEEEIFYPAFHRACGDDHLVQHSKQEHDGIRQRIAQVEAGERLDDRLMEKMQALVDDHVKDEREKMFPKARQAQGMDLMALAQQLERRKTELMAAHPA